MKLKGVKYQVWVVGFVVFVLAAIVDNAFFVPLCLGVSACVFIHKWIKGEW